MYNTEEIVGFLKWLKIFEQNLVAASEKYTLSTS